MTSAKLRALLREGFHVWHFIGHGGVSRDGTSSVLHFEDANGEAKPTDYLPHLLPTDVLYACGAPEMVDSIKSIAARVGAVCYADPFLPTTDDKVEESVLTRAMGWLAVPSGRQESEGVPERPRSRREQPMQAYGMAEARVRSHYRPQST